MTNDNVTYRHARGALSMLIDGAIRRLESNYGPEDNPDRQPAVNELFAQLREELDGWDIEDGGETAESSKG